MSDDEETPPISLRILMLGSEGCGKTTLTQQLKTIGLSSSSSGPPGTLMMNTSGRRANTPWKNRQPRPRGEWSMNETGMIPIAPTTGQEVEEIIVPSCGASRKDHSPAAAADNDDSFIVYCYHDDSAADHQPTGGTRKPPPAPGVVENGEEDDENPPSLLHHQDGSGDDRPFQPKRVSTVSHRPAAPGFKGAQIKEIGGRMLALWGKFVVKIHKEKDVPRALIFVLDAANVLQLSLGIVELAQLLSREEDIAHWKVCIVINKTDSPAAMSVDSIFELMGVYPLVSSTAPSSSAGSSGSEEEEYDGKSSGNDECLSNNAEKKLNEVWQLSPSIRIIALDSWSGRGMFALVDWMYETAG